jgi:hypothetical protein
VIKDEEEQQSGGRAFVAVLLLLGTDHYIVEYRHIIG